jgi:hypothetical protein
MTYVLLALLLGPLLQTGPRRSPEVEVKVSDVDGSADGGLAHALAQALIDAGLPARPAVDEGTICRLPCLRVTVRRTSEDLFVVEVRNGEQRTETPLRLDPSASSFDRAHALAVAVELAADRPRPTRLRHRARASAPERLNEPITPVALVAVRSSEPSASLAPVSPSPSDGTMQVRSSQPPPVPEERLALNVGLTSLGGTTGGLFMYGATVGLRLRVRGGVDVRAAVCLLRPQHVRSDGVLLRRELLPLQLAAAVGVPRLPSVRAGIGVELVSSAGDLKGQEMPAGWSPGPIARIEYRHQIRTFALLATIQGAYHHASWIAIGDGNPFFVLSPWTVSGSLGFEFRIL